MEETSSLKNKSIKGLFWSFCDLISSQGIQFIIQVILARLLVPKDFGIIGIIMVFVAISQALIDSGFNNAMIREKELAREDYSTVFFFNLFVSVLLYILLFFSSGAIGGFFREPQLEAVLRVLALTLVIGSFGLIQRTMMIRSINFKVQTKINIFSTVLSGAAAIAAAYMGAGVWSLVIKQLISQMLQSFLLCFHNRWRPVPVFRAASFKRLFSFGWKLMVSGFIFTLYNNLYLVVIGRIFSAVELGYYSNAQKLRDMAAQSVTVSVQKVSYPVLSSLQEDEERLRNLYKKLILTSVFVTFPMLLGLASVADPLIRTVFGQKWVNSIPYFQILCMAGMPFSLQVINLNILQVKGRSDLFLGLEIIKIAIGLASIAGVFLLRLGITALLWSTVLVSVISYFTDSFYSKKLIAYSTKQQIKDMLPILSAALIMAAAAYFTGRLLPGNNFVRLVLQTAVGVTVYGVTCKIIRVKEFETVAEIIGNILNRGHGRRKASGLLYHKQSGRWFGWNRSR